MPYLNRLLEVTQIIVVVGWSVVANFGNAGRRGVMNVGGGGVILEWIVVSDIGWLRCSVQTLRCGRANGGSIVRYGRRRKAALEPAPCDFLSIQKISDVFIRR